MIIEPQQRHHDIDDVEILDYVAELAEELAGLVRDRDFDTLSYLLSLVKGEASFMRQQREGAKAQPAVN